MRFRSPRVRIRTLMLLTALVAVLLGAPGAIRARQRRQAASLHAAQARFWLKVAERTEARGSTDGEPIVRAPGRPGMVARAVEAAKEYRRAAAYHEGLRQQYEDGW